MPLQKQFFCDRTTEKTVTLTVTDNLNKNTSVSTRKLSCQYPIFEIEDMTADHADNKQNNSWTVLDEFPSKAEIEKDETIAKTYKARLWVRKDETIVFKAKFGKGSHMNIAWNITQPSDEQDDCKTQDKPADITQDIDLTGGTKVVTVETSSGNDCKFPFRSITFWPHPTATEPSFSHVFP